MASPSNERLAAQLEIIEKYVNKDIARQDESITELFNRVSDVEKDIQTAKGSMKALTAIATGLGIIIGWGLQVLLTYLRLKMG